MAAFAATLRVTTRARAAQHVCTRPRARVRACAAPNEASFKLLAADLRAHLAAQEAATAAADPSDAAPAAQVLSYASLGKAGRSDLIERIMAHGGHPTVLARLQIALLPEEPARPPPRAVFAPARPVMRLVLGQRIEDRLSAPVTATATSKSVHARSRPVDDVPDAAVLAAALRDTRDVTAAAAAAAGEEREREVLTLDGRMRACALLLVALAAVGYGRASYGVVPGEVMAICALGADVLCVLHLVLAVYAAALSVTRLKRSPTLWAVKTLLGGVAAVHELRRLGATDSSTTCTE